jgi:hypothetical protein
MNSKVLSVFIFVLFFSIQGSAQKDTSFKSNDIFTNIEKGSQNRIQFDQKEEIHNLVLKHIAKNRHEGGISGYRIRIFSDLGMNARTESEEAKTRFYEHFPNIPIYRKYDSPYFKVYVGDFRTKIKAVKNLKRIKREFPKAFIVPDKINYPDLE